MTTGRIAPLLIKFTIPLILGNLFQLTYNAADSVIVGNFVGTSGLAAVGCTTPLMNIAILFISGMCMGASILMSMSFGSGNHDRLKKLLSTTLMGGLIFCFLVTLLGILFTPQLLHLIKVPKAVMPDAVSYLRIIFSALIFTFLYNFLANSMRALGDSRTPLIFLAISAVLNVFGDLFFVVVLHAGVHGAAIATVLSEILCTICCILYSRAKIPLLRLGRQWLHFERHLFGEIVSFSIASALQQACLQIGKVLIQSVADTMGMTVVAAFSVINRVDDFAYTPQQNIGHAMTTFLAQNKGAEQKSRIRKGFAAGIKIELVYGCLIGLIAFLFAGGIMELFVSHSISADADAVTSSGVLYLHLIAAMYLLPALTNGIQGFFRGMGELKVTLASTFMNMLGRVAAAYFFAYHMHMGIETFAFANLAGWIVMLLFEVPLLVHYLRLMRKDTISFEKTLS